MQTVNGNLKPHPNRRGKGTRHRHDLERAGVPYKTAAGRAERKCLRTTFGTQLSEAGVAIEQIAELMGHADIRTTQRRYLRMKAVDLQRSLGRLPGSPAAG